MYEILLAHDLTERSEIALVRAAQLTLEREGRLTIFHVVDSDLPDPVIEAQRADAERYLETEVRRRLGRDKPRYRIDIGVGDPADAIAAHAKVHGVSLVVAGRHRRRAIVDMFIGTTVERLLWQIQRPVLVVSNSNHSPYRRVLMALSGHGRGSTRRQLMTLSGRFSHSSACRAWWSCW